MIKWIAHGCLSSHMSSTRYQSTVRTCFIVSQLAHKSIILMQSQYILLETNAHTYIILQAKPTYQMTFLKEINIANIIASQTHIDKINRSYLIIYTPLSQPDMLDDPNLTMLTTLLEKQI